ncbi:hypothetical protein H1C71_021315, partial [Ictidomys tridecemlineatus]
NQQASPMTTEVCEPPPHLPAQCSRGSSSQVHAHGPATCSLGHWLSISLALLGCCFFLPSPRSPCGRRAAPVVYRVAWKVLAGMHSQVSSSSGERTWRLRLSYPVSQQSFQTNHSCSYIEAKGAARAHLKERNGPICLQKLTEAQLDLGRIDT